MTDRTVNSSLPEKVPFAAAIKRLADLGWGRRRIARALGCSPNTADRHIRKPDNDERIQPNILHLHNRWLREAFDRHSGNLHQIQADLTATHGISPSIRTLRRTLAPLRSDREAKIALEIAGILAEVTPNRIAAP